MKGERLSSVFSRDGTLFSASAAPHCGGKYTSKSAKKVASKRKWMFYVINVIFPILLVSTLNNVVLVLPVECGEKMSVSVTIFLTLAVFMTLIKDSLPNNSDTVCYLAVYLATQMTPSVVVIIMCAVIVKSHHSNSRVCVVSRGQGQDHKTEKNDITAHEVPNASESLILYLLLFLLLKN